MFLKFITKGGYSKITVIYCYHQPHGKEKNKRILSEYNTFVDYISNIYNFYNFCNVLEMIRAKME